MTTFKQFLLEETLPNIPALIDQYCPDYFEITGNQWIVRGMTDIPSGSKSIKFEAASGELATAYIITPRKDRLPLSTSPELHKKFDAYFKKAFGWKARSEGVFCAGNPSAMYGESYAIIPIGKWEYLWGKNVYDLTTDFNTLFSKVFGRDKWHEIGGLSGITQEIVDQVLDSGQYIDTELALALRRNQEIMLKCDKYLAIHIELLRT